MVSRSAFRPAVLARSRCSSHQRHRDFDALGGRSRRVALQPVFDHLQQNFLDPLKGVGYVSPWLLGGKSNAVAPESAVIPVRKDAVMWIHYGAQWNDEAVGQQALDWVDDLTDTLDDVVSDTAWFGIPDLQLGSQLTDPPNLDYMNAYWTSPQHDFVSFLIDVKNRYDCDDLFRFAQSIPLSMDDDLHART